MIVAGCDIGSLTAKAVILNNGEVVSTAVSKVCPKPEDSAKMIMNLALQNTDLTMENLDYSVGTGYGKDQISFFNRTESEISCHGKGAWMSDNSVRTIVDIGGQDAKSIKLDEQGNVTRFMYNDKCASGTGRFIEIMAEALELDLAEISSIGQQSKKELRLSNQCVVFAETEVISLINEGYELPDIINGLNFALASRVAALAKSIIVEENVLMTGGVAKNRGVFKMLEQALGVSFLTNKLDPQINGALGAAYYAEEALQQSTFSQ